MEHTQKELTNNKGAVMSVRDRIVGFHDRYIAAVPVADHLKKAFDEVSLRIVSTKGKEMVANITPKIHEYAKTVEVSVAAADLVGGVVCAGIGVDAYMRMRHKKNHAEKMAGGTTPDLRPTELGMQKANILSTMPRAIISGIASGIFFGARPLTRIVDNAIVPLAKRVALWSDTILLRKEVKQKAI